MCLRQKKTPGKLNAPGATHVAGRSGGLGRDQRRDAGNISSPHYQPEITNWSSSRGRKLQRKQRIPQIPDKPKRMPHRAASATIDAALQVREAQVCCRCGSWHYLSGSSSALFFMPSRLSMSRSGIGRRGTFLQGLPLLARGHVGIFGRLVYHFRLFCLTLGPFPLKHRRSAVNAIVHAGLFLLCFYFGFHQQAKVT